MSRLRVALEWFLNPDHLPFLIGMDLGWFQEEGLEIELVEPREHIDAAASLAAGEVDVAITEPIHLVQDVSNGAEQVGFARFLHTNGGVMVLASSGIERPSQLAGRRIQYPGAPGPVGRAIVATMIQNDGGEPGELVPVNHGFRHTAALAEGLADAATLVFYNFEVIEARFLGLSPRLFALKDNGVPDFCQLILVTRPDTLASREDEIAVLLRVLRRGIDLIQQDPETCRAIWNRRASAGPEDPLSQQIYNATIPCFTHDFTMSEASLDHLAAWLVECDIVEVAAGFERVWTNRLAVT